MMKCALFCLMIIGTCLANPCVESKSDCCVVCKDEFFLANCHCLKKGSYIEFISKMNEWIFFGFFVALPVTLGFVIYLILAKKEVSDLKLRGKTERIKPSIIYSARDMSVTLYVKQKTEVLDIDVDETDD